MSEQYPSYGGQQGSSWGYPATSAPVQQWNPAPQPQYGQAIGYAQPAPYGYGYQTPPPPTPFASVGKRLAARLIDLLLVKLVPMGIIGLALALDEMLTNEPGRHSSALRILANTLMIVGGLSYFLLPLWNSWIRESTKGSYGKKLLGIRVVRSGDLRPIGIGNAIGRDIAAYIDVFTLGIGFLWALGDPRRQRLSDKVAGTVVVEWPPPQGYGY